MSNDFTLSPDEPEVPEARPVKVVGEAVQQAKPGKVSAAYGPCPACHRPVLRGMTRGDEVITIDPRSRCYVIVWENTATMPRLDPSRAYVIHECALPIATKEKETV
jgi:hypothetical protein